MLKIISFVNVNQNDKLQFYHIKKKKLHSNFKYTPHGIKDCSNCNLPHVKEVGYAHIQKKMLEVIEIVQKAYLDKKEAEEKEKKQ